MAISYTTEHKNEHLIITASGEDDSIEDVENYTASIVHLCIERKINRLILDERNLIYTLSV